MKKVSFFVLFLLCVGHSYSQNIKEYVNMPSPNASSLGVYGESNVTLHSGVANVTVPIHTIQQPGLEVPIALNYATTGVRPEVHPGWVGMGWALNAGGLITRVVKGLPDEAYWIEKTTLQIEGDNYYEREPYIGNAHNYYILNNPDWSTTDNIKHLAKADDGYNSEGYKVDTEPDEFIFNFAGYSGKFYIGSDAQVVINGNKKTLSGLTVVGNPAISVELSIERYTDSYTPLYTREALTSPLGNFDAYSKFYENHITGCKITTPDGNQHYFGFFENGFDWSDFGSIDVSWDFFANGLIDFSIDAWHLVKSASPNSQNVINFEYDSPSIIASFSTTINAQKDFGEAKGFWFPFIGNKVSASNYSAKIRTQGRLIAPSYLTKIVTDNADYIFNKSVTTELKYNYASIVNSLQNQVLPNQKEGDYQTSFVDILGNKYEKPKYEYFDINTGVSYDARSNLWDNDGQGDLFILNRWDIAANNSAYYLDFDGLWKVLVPAYEVLDFDHLRWYQLDNIEIKDKSGNLEKKFNLKYSSSLNERLKLYSVQSEGKSGSALPPYLFEYENYDNIYTPEGTSHQQDGNTRKLPVYNTVAVDHWGYYNGADDPENTSKNGFALDLSLDDIDNVTTGYFEFRNSDADYLYSGILNKVIYPTGGYTSYFYEPNSYAKEITRNSDGAFAVATLGSAQLAGGLRVRKIENHDWDGSLQTEKTYEYYNGVLGYKAQYYWDGYNIDLYFNDDGVLQESDHDYTSNRFISHSVLPVSSNSVGSHIGYGKVIEMTEGNGRTEYDYSNYDDTLDDGYIETINLGSKTIYTPFGRKSFTRGILKETRTYNEGDLLVSKETNIYQPQPNLDYLPAIQTQLIPVFEGYTIEGTSYKIHTYPYNLTRKEVTAYDQSTQNPITTIKEFDYGSMNFLSEQRIRDSNDNWLKTKYKYLPDFPDHLLYTDMVGLNIINKPVEIVSLKNDQVTGAQINEYDCFGCTYIFGTGWQLNGGTFSPRRTHQLEIASPISDYAYATTSLDIDPRCKLLTTFEEYDNKGNLLQAVGQDQIATSYVWGYDQTLPVAKILNGSSDEVSHTSFEHGVALSDPAHYLYYEGWKHTAGQHASDESRTGDHSIVVNGPSAIVESETLFTGDYIVNVNLKNSGEVFFNDVSQGSVDTSGEWKSQQYQVALNNEKLEIKITGSLYLDELRMHKPGAQVTTYTYEPLIGMTSQTDPNGITIHYRYDEFGRMKEVRDDDNNVIQILQYHYRD